MTLNATTRGLSIVGMLLVLGISSGHTSGHTRRAFRSGCSVNGRKARQGDGFFKPPASSNSTGRSPDLAITDRQLWGSSSKGIENATPADGVRRAFFPVLRKHPAPPRSHHGYLRSPSRGSVRFRDNRPRRGRTLVNKGPFSNVRSPAATAFFQRSGGSLAALVARSQMSPSVTRREKYASRPSRVSCGGPMMSRGTEKTFSTFLERVSTT